MNCPQCGAAIVLRCFGQAETVVCASCHAVLDAKDPNLTILQRFDAATRGDKPLIPLGTRGTLRATPYDVIGFQRRSITVDGVTYSWHEYVLFNPYKGFRYLSEYNGHWNDVTVCKQLPTCDGGMLGVPTSRANYLGENFKHFQSATATTSFVLGEFPWQVRVGEQAFVTDYVNPPRLLSSEKVGNEVTWSVGEYMYGRDVWRAFNLPGSPPEAVGVFENQPSTTKQTSKGVAAAFLAFAVFLLVLMAIFDFIDRKDLVMTQSYTLLRGQPRGEASFVTEPFDLNGRLSNVELTTSTNVDNSWIYLNYALINEDTGQAWDFGREVSYYHGYDSDGSWTEGKPTDSVVVPSVPAGRYYLRIEPEVDPLHPAINYEVTLRRDVPVGSFYLLAFVALLIPAILIWWRSYSFERSRWAESDHPPIKFETSSSEDDD